ncbi:Uncharacterised protein [uncultured archaeon]|nr:Uncharacterised protein [uncultured archaeon]
MGLLDYLGISVKSKTIVKYYTVSNGNENVYYILGKFLKGKKLTNRYWQEVDSEWKALTGKNCDKKMQCISTDQYNNIIERSKNPANYQNIQGELEKLSEQTTPECEGEGVLVKLYKKENKWTFRRIGNAKPEE